MSPTGRLLLLLCAPALLALGAVITPEIKPWVMLLDGLLLALVLVDLWTLPRRRQLLLERRAKVILSIGAPSAITLELRNTARRPLLVELTESLPAALEGAGLPASVWAAPGQLTRVTYTVVPRRRGAFSLGRTFLRSESRLRLWRRHLTVTLPHRVKVFPDVKALNTYALLARRNRIDLMGFRKTRGRGSDVEFHRLRDYQSDDDYRRIDPFASARCRRLITREYEVSRNQNIFFMIDCSRIMAGESQGLSNLDHALNATLMLSSLALDLGDNVGLMAFDEQVRAFLPPSSGMRSNTAVLHALYDLHVSSAGADYEKAFLALHRRVRQRSLVVLLTNMMDRASFDLLQPHLRILTRRHLPLILLLRDEDLFDLADGEPASARELFEVGAAAELAIWRERLAADLQRTGSMVLDITPRQATADLINSYLRIKADQLL